jgi:hypothetical protein
MLRINYQWVLVSIGTTPNLTLPLCAFFEIGATTIKQRLQFVGREEGKLLAVRQIVQEGLKPPVIIFVQSKERAASLFRELVYDGLNVDVIHAERTQTQVRVKEGREWCV